LLSSCRNPHEASLAMPIWRVGRLCRRARFIPTKGAVRNRPGVPAAMSMRERLARQPPGYQYTIGRILAIYSGLMVALLLAALDQTIVATALPKVVSDLGGITQYTWVFTAYMLGSTVTVPLYGKLGDVHGRKHLFIVAVVIFLVGSALCGARSEEHTSELQSRVDLVCRLLLEKK